MAGEDKISFKLDLDAEGAHEALKKLGEHLLHIVDKDKQIEKLVSQFKTLAIIGGGVAIAYQGVKAAIGFVAEAEEIKGVINQFEVLTEQAGIATDTLKEGMAKAAGGIIDDTNLLKIANESIVAMGKSAERLPELMNLARKATSVFGGDTEERFRSLTASISTLNLKALKQIGITVDADKAMRDYAKQLGVAKDELSEAGRKQAVLNAVLEAGSKQFGAISDSGQKTKTILSQIDVAFSDLKEAAQLAFEAIAGNTVRSGLQSILRFAKELKTEAMADFGKGAEKASAQIETMTKRLEYFNAVLEQNETMGGKLYDEQTIRSMKAQRDELEKTIAVAQGAPDLSAGVPMAGRGQRPKAEPGIGEADKAGMIETEKVKARIAEMEAKILDAKLKQNEAAAIGATTDTQLEEIISKRAAMEDALVKAKLEALDQQAVKEPEKVRVIEAEKLQILAESANRQKGIENELRELRLRNAEEQVKNARTVADGMAAGFKEGSLRAKQDFQDMGKRGRDTFNTLNKTFVDSMTTWATTSAHGADIIKGFFLNMLGERAEAEGKLLIASSIFPPNPLGIAAGTALLGLGAYLKSKAGGAAGGGPSPGGAGGGAPDVSSGGTTVAREEQKRKSVTVQVMGNYFETEQTKTRLMELIRESTDATDFKYVQIGQN